MRAILEQYILLENKADLRANKVKAMQAFLVAFETEEPLSLNEIKMLMGSIPIRQLVFEQLIYPTLNGGIEAESIEAVNLMLELIQHVYAFQSRREEWKYYANDLIDIGLRLDPLDNRLRKMKYDSAVQFLSYSIHEVPIGVLWDNDGANEIQCQELLEYADEFEQLSQSLSRDDSELLAQCRYYYRSYAAYLAARASYANFAAYLEQHPHQ